MGGRLGLKAVALLLLLALPACAGLPPSSLAQTRLTRAASAPGDDGSVFRRLAAARIGTRELAGMRGGIRIDGIDFGLGLTLRTTEATRQLVSELTLTDSGQWVAGSAAAGGAPVALTGIGTGDFRAVLGDPMTTEIVHSLDGNGIGSTITNRLDNVVITQAAVLNLTINNYAQLSRSLLSMPMVSRMGHDLARFGTR